MLLPNTVTSPLHHLITSSNPCSRYFGKAQLELTDCTANQLPFIIQNLKFNIIILHHSSTQPLLVLPSNQPKLCQSFSTAGITLTKLSAPTFKIQNTTQ